MLSDGRTTIQAASRAIRAAKNAKVFVDTVSLNSPGGVQDPEALRRLAERTGGQAFEVSDANALVDQFSSIGRALASQYVVEMELPSGLDKQVDLKLEVHANNEVGIYHNPSFVLPGGVSPTTIRAIPGGLPSAPGLSRLESPQGRYVIAITGFTTVLLACLLLFGAGTRGPKPHRVLRQRLSRTR